MMIFPTAADLIGAVFGLILTLIVLSYLLGDNPAFRFAVHLFVGVSAGLAGAVAVRNVVVPYILLPLIDFSSITDWLGAAALLLLAAMLLLKLSPRFRGMGNLPMAFIVGVGAAVVLSGAVVGTLIPQIGAASDLFNLRTLPADTPFNSLLGLINRFIAIVGTVATLAYFHFSVRSNQDGSSARPGWVQYAARTGQVFIAVTFGVLFAGVLSAAMVAWVDRWNFIVSFLTSVSSAFLGG